MVKVLTPENVILGLSLVVCVASFATTLKRGKAVAGNGCPESAPWPCKTPGKCLSFDFICDGEPDCDDRYDEDPALCIAKDRPPAVLIKMFIEKWRNWLIPNILANKDINELADQMIESKTIEEYAENVGLSPTQFKNLRDVMEAVNNGRQIDLLLMGMPERAWNEIYILFGRIVKSGFLGKQEHY